MATNTAKNPTKICPKALAIFATCSWPSLCEQSELQCWRRNRRLCGPAPLQGRVFKIQKNLCAFLSQIKSGEACAHDKRTKREKERPALDLLGFQPAQGRRQGFFRTISTYLIFNFEHPTIKDLGKKWFGFSKMEILTPNELVERINRG